VGEPLNNGLHCVFGTCLGALDLVAHVEDQAPVLAREVLVGRLDCGVLAWNWDV
jgi:hypothetical protein